jgi:hypothetical protein
LKSIWLHWTVAHAAGLGTLAGWVVLYDWFQQHPRAVRQNDLPFFVCGALGILLFLGCVRQFMLRYAGWRAPLWAVCSALGLPIAVFLGTIVGSIGASIGFAFPWSVRLAIVGTTFSGGCVLGVIQFIAVRGSNRQHVFWMAASGLAMFAAASILFLFPSFPFFRARQWILVATVVGGCYGSITGAALIYLLSREQQRRRRDNATSSE